jgi:hypothetical protein
VIENDFDLTDNLFSYTSLKELAAKVPENSLKPSPEAQLLVISGASEDLFLDL